MGRKAEALVGYAVDALIEAGLISRDHLKTLDRAEFARKKKLPSHAIVEQRKAATPPSAAEEQIARLTAFEETIFSGGLEVFAACIPSASDDELRSMLANIEAELLARVEKATSRRTVTDTYGNHPLYGAFEGTDIWSLPSLEGPRRMPTSAKGATRLAVRADKRTQFRQDLVPGLGKPSLGSLAGGG